MHASGHKRKPVLHNVDEAAKRRFNIVPFIRKPAGAQAPSALTQSLVPCSKRWCLLRNFCTLGQVGIRKRSTERFAHALRNSRFQGRPERGNPVHPLISSRSQKRGKPIYQSFGDKVHASSSLSLLSENLRTLPPRGHRCLDVTVGYNCFPLVCSCSALI